MTWRAQEAAFTAPCLFRGAVFVPLSWNVIAPLRYRILSVSPPSYPLSMLKRLLMMPLFFAC